MKKQKSVASVSGGTASTGDIIVGVSDVIRWNDVMTVQGYPCKVSKAVTLGLKYKLTIAQKLEKDLKSKVGLHVTFPIAYLMSELQEKVGSGKKLLALVKP